MSVFTGMVVAQRCAKSLGTMSHQPISKQKADWLTSPSYVLEIPTQVDGAALSGGPPDLRPTLGLTCKTAPEHEDGEGSQGREQPYRAAPGEPKDDETGQGYGSTDQRVWDLCGDVIDEMYA
jgi:hypothetical protein